MIQICKMLIKTIILLIVIKDFHFGTYLLSTSQRHFDFKTLKYLCHFRYTPELVTFVRQITEGTIILSFSPTFVVSDSKSSELQQPDIFSAFLRLRSAVLVLGVVRSDDGHELRSLGPVGVSGYPSDPTLVSLWALCMNDQNSRVEKQPQIWQLYSAYCTHWVGNVGVRHQHSLSQVTFTIKGLSFLYLDQSADVKP